MPAVPQDARGTDQPYVGRWAPKAAWCKNDIRSGTDEIPVAITRQTIDFHAASCRIVSIERRGKAWRARTSCRGEGAGREAPRTAVTYGLRVDGDRLTLSDHSGPKTFRRCRS